MEFDGADGIRSYLPPSKPQLTWPPANLPLMSRHTPKVPHYSHLRFLIASTIPTMHFRAQAHTDDELASAQGKHKTTHSYPEGSWSLQANAQLPSLLVLVAAAAFNESASPTAPTATVPCCESTIIELYHAQRTLDSCHR